MSQRRLVYFLIWLFFAAVLSLSLSLLAITIAITTAGLICVVFTKKPGLAYLLLGTVTPLIPLFGSGTLLIPAFALVSISVDRDTTTASARSIFYPWIGLLLGWVVLEIVWPLDVGYAEWFATFHSSQEIRNALRISPPHILPTMQAFMRMVVLVTLFWRLCTNELFRSQFAHGIAFGLVVALPISCLQILGHFPTIFINNTHFWITLDRAVGTFSDPNSFGVFIGLALIVLVQRIVGARRGPPTIGWVGVVLGWLLLTPYAGSRTFFLALVIWSLLLLWVFKRRWLMRVGCGGCVALLVWNVFIMIAPEAFNGLIAILPSGGRRLANALDLAMLGDTFASRLIFWRLSIAAWWEAPLTGIGFHRFPLVVTAIADRIGIPLAGWSDNPNSFYLGVFAELGVLGGVILAGTAMQFRVRRNVGSPKNLLAYGAIVLFILLLIGPHTDFDEVALLAALFLAEFVVVRERLTGISLPGKLCAVAALGVFTVLAVYHLHSARGLYPAEIDSEGKLFQWSSKEAYLSLPCDSPAIPRTIPEANRVAQISLRVIHPDLHTHPVTMTLQTHAENQSRTMTDTTWQIFTFECRSHPHIPIMVRVSRTMIPAQLGWGADYRILGAQLRYTALE